MPTKSNSNGLKGKSGQGAISALVWVLMLIAVGGLFYWMGQKSGTETVCSTANLKLSAGQQSGAAGTIYQHMALTNTGKQSCTMAGFPTALLYGSDGNALGSGAAARPQPAPMVITLAVGETAHTVLGYPQAGNFPSGVCTDAKSVTLKLYPPGSAAPLETPLEIAWCPGFSETAMQAGN